MNLTHCPLCEDTVWRDYYIFDRVHLVKCGGCGLVFNPQPTMVEYEQSERQYGAQNLAYRQMIQDILEHTALVRYKRLQKYVRQPGRLLEIGGATGEFCHIARSNGWNVEMLELSAPFVREAFDRYGIIARREVFSETGFELQSLDAICMFHVFEHLPDPNEILRIAYNLLKPQGYILLILPNLESFTDGLYGNKNPDLVKEDHLIHYTIPTICRMLLKNRFETCAAFSSEPAHHIWTSLYGFASTLRRKKRIEFQDKAIKPSASALARLPYNLGGISKPFMYPYRKILEQTGRGHEIFYIGKKRE